MQHASTSLGRLRKKWSVVAKLAGITYVSACGLACAANGGHLESGILLQKIHSEGAEAVYKRDLIGKDWLLMLDRVESGKKEWLQVAIAIYPATDGGPAEDMAQAAGAALRNNAFNVLQIAVPTIPLQEVCSYSEMAIGYGGFSKREDVIRDIDARIAAVRELNDSKIAFRKKQCLQYLAKGRDEFLQGKIEF
jgi:hypothetical protein